ncbi:MAG: hypothetical protein OHK005_11320 [Candidatus Methylacidiphilales bacterium]
MGPALLLGPAMTPRLDLSDFLVPLIFIGVAIYQVLTQKKKANEDPQDPSPFPDEFDPGKFEDERTAPQSWDELMEALGQKPESPRAPEPPPVPVAPAPSAVVPPPLPRRIDPEPIVQASAAPAPRPSPEASFWGGPNDLSSYRRSPLKPDGSARAFAAQAVRFREVPGFDAVQLRRTLQQPERLREAILINELLQKPVALRGPVTGWSG